VSRGVSTRLFLAQAKRCMSSIDALAKKNEQSVVMSGASSQGILSFTLLATSKEPELRLDFIIDSKGYISLDCPQLKNLTSAMRELSRDIFANLGK
jgi:hypothetical protein